MVSKRCRVCREGNYNHVYDYQIREAQLLCKRATCRGCAVIAAAVEAFRPLRSSSEATVSILRRVSEYDGCDNYYLEVKGPGVLRNVVEIFTTSSPSPWPSIPTRRLVSAQALSDSCITLARSWITECVSSHPQCRSSIAAAWRPTRLVDVGSGGSDDPKLCILGDNRSDGASAISPDYVALSHCWGQHQPLRLLSHNLAAFQRAIPAAALPPTFQQAMEAVRRLGFRHIWIDSLCIVQDSPDDWRRESVRMRQVYEQAALALYADAGPDGASGLTAAACRADWRQTRLADGLYARCVFDWTLYVEAPVARDIAPHCPGRNEVSWLHHRGWTYQERMIPRRRLHFGAYEMAWECQARGDCECAGEDSEVPGQRYEGSEDVLRFWDVVQGGGGGHDGGSVAFCSLWCDIVAKFTTRTLSFGTDVLPALSGIASVATARLGLTYLAGLWAEFLDTMLLWQVSLGSIYGERHPAYYAPSWTWASRVGRDVSGTGMVVQVFFLLHPESQPAPGFRVRRAVCTYPDNNVLLPPLDGFLDVDAYMVELDYADVSKSPQPPGVAFNSGHLSPDIFTNAAVDSTSDSEVDSEEEEYSWDGSSRSAAEPRWASQGYPEMRPGQPYWFFVIRQSPYRDDQTTLEGIVVRSSMRVSGAYERVAYYECIAKDASAWVRHCQERSIRIV